MQEFTELAEYINARTDELSIIIESCESTKNGLMTYLQPAKGGTVDEIDDEHKSELLKMELHGH